MSQRDSLPWRAQSLDRVCGGWCALLLLRQRHKLINPYGLTNEGPQTVMTFQIGTHPIRISTQVFYYKIFFLAAQQPTTIKYSPSMLPILSWKRGINGVWWLIILVIISYVLRMKWDGIPNSIFRKFRDFGSFRIPIPKIDTFSEFFSE